MPFYQSIRRKKRVSLGIKQLTDDPWKKDIPEKFSVGDIVKGKVTKITNFGAFLDLGNSIEGLLHISEVSNEKVKKLEQVISIGQELDVKIVTIEPEARKIGLSLKGIEKTSEQESKPQEEQIDTKTSNDIGEEKVDTKASDDIEEEKADDIKEENT